MSHISDIWSLFNSDINMGPEGWVPKRSTWPQSSVQYSIYRVPKCSKVMHKDWFVPLSAGEEGGWTCGQESLGSGTANPRDVANAVKPSRDTIKPSVTLSCQNTQYFLLCSCRMDGEPHKKWNKLVLCQISQIVRVWVMKGWVSKYCEPPSVFHQPSVKFPVFSVKSGVLRHIRSPFRRWRIFPETEKARFEMGES